MVSVAYAETPSHRRLVKEIALLQKKPKEPEEAPETPEAEEE